MIELTLDGYLVKDYREADYTYVSPSVGIGFFITDVWEVGGRLELLSISDFTEYIYGLNTKYHLRIEKNAWPYVGIGLESEFGNIIYDTTPIQLQCEVGIKYWPMETGAITLSFFVWRQFSEKTKETSVGVDLGILIRIR